MTVTINRLKNQLIRSKEEAQFEAIFEEHWDRIIAVLFRLVGDRDEAEDLALETFWRLHRHPPTDKREHNLAGWLYRVATNLGFNALRARKRRQHYEQEAGKYALEQAYVPNPALEVERHDQQQQVRRVLLEMKPRSAQLLILRYSGFSYAELADVLKVSRTSIGTLLARAEREFERHAKRHALGGGKG